MPGCRGNGTFVPCDLPVRSTRPVCTGFPSLARESWRAIFEKGERLRLLAARKREGLRRNGNSERTARWQSGYDPASIGVRRDRAVDAASCRYLTPALGRDLDHRGRSTALTAGSARDTAGTGAVAVPVT